MAEKGQNHCRIARTLGVTEGAVRYQLQRLIAWSEDGRKKKRFKAEALAGVIGAWVEQRRDRERPVNVGELHEHLMEEWRYAGSYRSVLRYVRRHWPKPKVRNSKSVGRTLNLERKRKSAPSSLQ